MTLQSCSDAGVQFVHESFIAIFKVHVHIVSIDWKDEKLSEKILADFNRNMIHFKEHFRKENFVRRSVKVLFSDFRV
jgi:hypothetical protein